MIGGVPAVSIGIYSYVQRLLHNDLEESYTRYMSEIMSLPLHITMLTYVKECSLTGYEGWCKSHGAH